MIDAVVKSMDWTDPIPEDWDKPAAITVYAEIGSRGGTGADVYKFLVCNPQWIAEQLQTKPGLWPRGYLIMNDFNAGYIERTIQALADQFRNSANVADFAERLNRFLVWEFQDMDDYQGEPKVPGI